ncbi:MAG: hypothetical protein OEO21_08590 [Candidatus Krumholzibacteria bacterium]|nr:hypothetical protein [Candidatus Krumholzibacteria bacterium]
MEDDQFVAKLNRIAGECRLALPGIDSEAPSAEAVAAWAGFLEACVRRGIRLSDPRWKRLTLSHAQPAAVFTMGPGSPGNRDADFRVGLQLLVGMLHDEAPPETSEHN